MFCIVDIGVVFMAHEKVLNISNYYAPVYEYVQPTLNIRHATVYSMLDCGGAHAALNIRHATVYAMLDCGGAPVIVRNPRLILLRYYPLTTMESVVIESIVGIRRCAPVNWRCTFRTSACVGHIYGIP